MYSEHYDQIRKVLFRLMLVGMALFLSFGAGSSPAAQAEGAGPQTIGRYYTVTPLTLSNGTLVDEVIINGPPTPPPGFEPERQAVSLPAPDSTAGIKTLTVPAFNWVFGCSSVSGAMIAGYYDRTGFPNMYTGPTNGGVMPINNSSWPTWSDGFSTYPSCPLIASRNGVDGRAASGSIDDYWVQYNSAASDPYITNVWPQHTWGDAIGDYMKTSQSASGNIDGSTTFWNYTSSATPLTCSDMETYSLQTTDGTYGRKLFYEARGYTVTDCYSQKTDNTIAGGFSFAQFKAEIDADRPVMLNLAGHTVVGVGYDDSSNLVYIHDTWDYSDHTMTWGSSYSGMDLLSVSIVNLEPPTITVVSPNGGEAWRAGSKHTISWTYTGEPGQFVKIRLLKNGVFNSIIAESVPGGTSGNGSYTWTIPPTQRVGADYKVKITSTSNTAYTDTSDNTFSVAPVAPGLTVVSPNGGENWKRGGLYPIQWTYKGNPGAIVKIELFNAGVLQLTITESAPVGTGGAGTFDWTIPSTHLPLGKNYKIKITSTTKNTCKDSGDAVFTISK